MRKFKMGLMVAAAMTSGAAIAQQTGNDTGTATETQERYSEGQGDDFPIGLLGLLGLAGLAGLRKRDTVVHDRTARH